MMCRLMMGQVSFHTCVFLMVILTTRDVSGQTQSLKIKLPVRPLDTAEVEALRRDIAAASTPMQKAELQGKLAHEFIAADRWALAVRALRRAVDLVPRNSIHWMRLISAYCLLDDQEAYRKAVAEMRGSVNLEAGFQKERIAKMGALSSEPVGELRELGQQIDETFALVPEQGMYRFFGATQALVRYRLQRYDDALESVAISDRFNQPTATGSAAALNRAVEAMCYARMGDAVQAKISLERCEQLLQQDFSKPEFVRRAPGLHDWIIALILFEEAQEVVAEVQ